MYIFYNNTDKSFNNREPFIERGTIWGRGLGFGGRGLGFGARDHVFGVGFWILGVGFWGSGE